MQLTIAKKGDTKTFSTIEQVCNWLCSKWPVDDMARRNAVIKINDAMDCIGSVTAALTAGFVRLTQYTHNDQTCFGLTDQVMVSSTDCQSWVSPLRCPRL